MIETNYQHYNQISMITSKLSPVIIKQLENKLKKN